MTVRDDRLVVWLGDEPVGDLVRTRRNDLRFTRRLGAPSLTVAPDGAATTWTPSFTRAWFDGLLPEEGRRTVAEAEHGIARGDSFGLLAAIGWECAGAVSVLPDGRVPAAGTYATLTDNEVWERLDGLPRTVSDLDHDVRLSLGGAQDKLLLARLGGAWQLPLDGAVSTHILKPEPDRYPGLAVGEAWALAVTSAATLSASADFVEPAGHRPTIVVERYDRRVEGGTVRRFHQEDGCQILGLPPELKYPRGIGPRVASLARISAVLVERAVDPIAELGRLLEQTVANVALLNTDAHAKNLSVLHTGPGTVSLSPLYDVSAAWFLPTQSQAALPVGGKWRIERSSAGTCSPRRQVGVFPSAMPGGSSPRPSRPSKAASRMRIGDFRTGRMRCAPRSRPRSGDWARVLGDHRRPPELRRPWRSLSRTLGFKQ